MKGRWLPFLATTAALALAAVAPAQDRGRSRGGGGGDEKQKSPPASRPERSSPPPSRPERSSPPPSRERNSPPERSSPPDRPTDRSRGESRSRPDRTERPAERPPERPGNSGGSNDRPTRTDSGNSRPPVGGGDRDRGNDRTSDRSGNDRSGGLGRPTRNDQPTDNRGSRVGGSDSARSVLDRPVRHVPRSGNVSYGTLHNGYGGARPSRFGSAPSRGMLGEQIRRTRPRTGYNVSFGGTVGGLRIGYCAYNGAWYDDNFCYPFYVFDPWAPNVYCVASPWYRYSFLPGYVNNNRVIVVNNYVPTWGSDGWNDYRYDRSDQRNAVLNDSLDDLRDAFERNSTRYADRLLPLTGQVAVYNDGRYDYSLSADDFRDMFLDGVEQSKTIRYQITESQFRGDIVHVRARHEYEDSWGQKQVVYHMLTLQRERDGYVIREFGTE